MVRTQSPWSTLRLTLDVAHSVHFDNCIVTRVCCYAAVRNRFTALKSSVLCPFLAPSPAHPWQPFVSIVMPFPGCHTLGATECEAFSYCLLSRSHVRLRFLCVFSRLDSSCRFSTEYYSVVWKYPSLSAHLLKGIFGCFQVGAIMNEAEINMRVQVVVRT